MRPIEAPPAVAATLPGVEARGSGNSGSEPREARAAPPPVQVLVSGVRDAQGIITASICNEREYERDHCAAIVSVPAVSPSTALVFSKIPPGRYAVVAYHDRNRNGSVDVGVLGVPLEGVGFSRNPRLWRRPRFEDVALYLGERERLVSVKLNFEPG